MTIRRILALVLAVLALPLVFLGLIDPLEGGVTLLLATVLGAAAWLLSRTPVPRLAWVSLAVTLAVGALVLILVVAAVPAVEDTSGAATAVSPLPAGARVLVWAYRLGVVATLAGAVQYVVRIAAALRGPSPKVRPTG